MFHSLFRRHSEKDVIAWLTKLDLLLSMDAPILMAVHQLANDPDLRRRRAVTNDIGNLLQSGWTLAEALEKHTKTFGSLHLYVAAAEHTGTVGTALHRIATAYAQLHSISIPVGVSYTLEDDGMMSGPCLTAPAITQANELFLSLINGEHSAPGRSVVVEQTIESCEYSCAVYALGDGAKKMMMDLPWKEGRHLLQRILLMANMNYWDKSKRVGSIQLKLGLVGAEFEILREDGEFGQMKITVRKRRNLMGNEEG